MDYRLLIDTAVLAGEIMLRNGAETYRVEDTISRMLCISNLKHIEAVVMTTSIIATISDPKMDAITVVRRVRERGTNLNKIYLVNQVSRMFCENKIDLQTAFVQLKEIKKQKQYSMFLSNTCIILVAGFYTMLLGGMIFDCIIASVCGILLVLTSAIGEKIHLNQFVTTLVASAIMAFFANNVAYFFPVIIHTDRIIIGSIMALVPGVAITNAIRDTLQGDYMSGGARALEAFIKALSIALGVGTGITIYQNILGR